MKESSKTKLLTRRVPIAAITHCFFCGVSLIYLFYCLKVQHMSLPNPILSFSVCDQVRPTDSQYRDYKRSGDSFWSKLDSVKLDTGKLEHLFETKSKEMPVTKVNNQCLKWETEVYDQIRNLCSD